MTVRRKKRERSALFAFVPYDNSQGVAYSGSMQFTGNVERYSLILGSNVADRDRFKAAVGLKIEDKFTTEVLRSMAWPFCHPAVTLEQRVFGCPVPLIRYNNHAGLFQCVSDGLGTKAMGCKFTSAEARLLITVENIRYR